MTEFLMAAKATHKDIEPDSSYSLPLFSPLTSVMPRTGLDLSTTSTQGSPQACSGTSPTLSPLTINAQDVSLSLGDSRAASQEKNRRDVTTPTIEGRGKGGYATPLLWEDNKENCITPYMGTSTPSRAFTVRISARKLKEIESPYASDRSGTISYASDRSSTISVLSPIGNATKQSPLSRSTGYGTKKKGSSETPSRPSESAGSRTKEGSPAPPSNSVGSRIKQGKSGDRKTKQSSPAPPSKSAGSRRSPAKFGDRSSPAPPFKSAGEQGSPAKSGDRTKESSPALPSKSRIEQGSPAKSGDRSSPAPPFKSAGEQGSPAKSGDRTKESSPALPSKSRIEQGSPAKSGDRRSRQSSPAPPSKSAGSRSNPDPPFMSAGSRIEQGSPAKPGKGTKQSSPAPPSRTSPLPSHNASTSLATEAVQVHQASRPQRRPKTLEHSVKRDQRKSVALKQGVVLENNDTSDLSHYSDPSILVVESSTSSQDQKKTKMKLLNECRDHVGQGARTLAPAQLGKRLPHQIHLITSNLATEDRNLTASDSQGRQRTSAGEDCVTAKASNPGHCNSGGGDSDGSGGDGGGRSAGNGNGGVDVPTPPASSSSVDPGTATAKPWYGGTSGMDTAHIIATCAAAATAAVIKASSLENQNPLKDSQNGSSKDPVLRVDGGTEMSPKEAVHRSSGIKKSSVKFNLDSPDGLQYTQDQPQPSTFAQSSKGAHPHHWDYYVPDRLVTKASSSEKGARGSRNEKGVHPHHRDHCVLDHQVTRRDVNDDDGGGGGDMMGGVTGRAQVNDMLRRLQMLEEMQHLKMTSGTMVAAQPNIPYHPITSIATNLGKSPPVSLNASEHTTGIDGESTVGYATTTSFPVLKPTPAAAVAGSQEWPQILKMREANKMDSGSTEQWIQEPSSHGVSTPAQQVPTMPEPKLKEHSTPGGLEADFSQIESVLQRVQLSQREVEFQYSMAEMEGENSHMGKLLELLTTSSPNKASAAKMSVVISNYLCGLSPLPSPSCINAMGKSPHTPPENKVLGGKEQMEGVIGGRPRGVLGRKQKTFGSMKERGVVESSLRKKTESGKALKVKVNLDELPRQKDFKPKSNAMGLHHFSTYKSVSKKTRSPSVPRHSNAAKYHRSPEDPLPSPLPPPLKHPPSPAGHSKRERNVDQVAVPLSSAAAGGGADYSKRAHSKRNVAQIAVPLWAPCIMPSPLDSSAGITELAATVGDSTRRAGDRQTQTADACQQTSLKSGCENDGVDSASTLSSPDETPQQTSASAAVRIKGHHRSSPSRPPLSSSFVCPGHATPTTVSYNMGVVCQESVSSEELDKRIRKHQETKATEWVQKELMARILCQLEYPRDPLTSHLPASSSDSCSTYSPPPSDEHGGGLDPLLGNSGLQVFVGAGMPVDQDVVEKEIRSAIRSELCQLIEELTGKQGSIHGIDTSAEEEFSYTPPSPGSTSNTPMSPLSTPVLTPSPSSSPAQSSKLQELPPPEEEQSYLSISTPSVTPPPSEKSVALSLEIDATLNTPQETDTEVSISSSSHHTSTKSSYPSVFTPLATPTPDSPPTVSTPPPTSETQTKPPTKSPPPSPPKEISLSSSLSSGSTTTPLESNSSSTSSTDPPISMGEFILKKHPVLINGSLSEGEVPLSPGDARWSTLHAAKMKGDLGFNSTLEAFLDLKNSPDMSSISDLSELSDSLQAGHTIYSVGEVQKHPAQPFKKFLSKVNAANVEAYTSTTENTLSELPSLDIDDTLPSQALTTSSPVKRKGVPPHHKKNPFRVKSMLKGYSSPGEVKKHSPSVNFALGPKSKRNYIPLDASVSFAQSEGEIPAIITKNRISASSKKTAMRDERHSGSTNQLRDGIDVINISKHSMEKGEAHAPLVLAPPLPPPSDLQGPQDRGRTGTFQPHDSDSTVTSSSSRTQPSVVHEKQMSTPLQLCDSMASGGALTQLSGEATDLTPQIDNAVTSSGYHGVLMVRERRPTESSQRDEDDASSEKKMSHHAVSTPKIISSLKDGILLIREKQPSQGEISPEKDIHHISNSTPQMDVATEFKSTPMRAPSDYNREELAGEKAVSSNISSPTESLGTVTYDNQLIATPAPAAAAGSQSHVKAENGRQLEIRIPTGVMMDDSADVDSRTDGVSSDFNFTSYSLSFSSPD